MPNHEIDPEDVAVGTAIGDSNKAKRRRRRSDDEDDDYDEVDTNSARSLWTTGLVVIGGLIMFVALVVTLSGS